MPYTGGRIALTWRVVGENIYGMRLARLALNSQMGGWYWYDVAMGIIWDDLGCNRTPADAVDVALANGFEVALVESTTEYLELCLSIYRGYYERYFYELDWGVSLPVTINGVVKEKENYRIFYTYDGEEGSIVEQQGWLQATALAERWDISELAELKEAFLTYVENTEKWILTKENKNKE